MPERLPAPGPSFLREQELRVGDRVLQVGMSRPSIPADDWWTALLWVAAADGLVSFVELAALDTELEAAKASQAAAELESQLEGQPEDAPEAKPG